MKKLFKKIGAAIQKAFAWLRPKVNIALAVINFLKSVVDSEIVSIAVALTNTKLDDKIVDVLKNELPKVAEKLQMADMIMMEGKTAEEILNIIIDYLKKQNKTVRGMFYAQLAALLTQALSDGKIDNAEALTISQFVYTELKNNENN